VSCFDPLLHNAQFCQLVRSKFYADFLDRVNGGNMNTLSNLMIIAAIHNRIAWQWVLDVRFINGLSLVTGIVEKMC